MNWDLTGGFILDRTILHCDCNSFYASVETALNPSLKNVPMAVAGSTEMRRGIILAKNDIAKKFGVTTAETIWQAKKKCENLVLVPPQHREYAKYSKMLNEIYYNFTELVEPFGIDESYLDVTGSLSLFGDGEKIATEIRNLVREKLGITVSIGVSFNKVFAKLGSDYKKPDATTVINRESFREIIFPLPVGDLLYVGKQVKKTLLSLNITTIGDLACAEKKLIEQKLGKVGAMVHEYANGLDDSPVKSVECARDLKSVGNGTTFSRNLLGRDDVKTGIIALCEEVASRMRKTSVVCQTVQVTIKDPQFITISKQKALKRPTNLSKDLLEASFSLIESSWNFNLPIRMITITATNLSSEAEVFEQLSLFKTEEEKLSQRQEKLEHTIDKIREKHGFKSVMIGTLLDNDIGVVGRKK